VLRIFSVAIVLGAEAIASVLLERLHSGLLTFFLIVASIAALVFVMEIIPELLVKHTNWGARLFGMRLRSGREVHGYWYTTIRGDSTRGSGRQSAGTTTIGGTVLWLKATRDGFELEGETYMIAKAEWTSWSGVGSSMEANEILFRYRGAEESEEDIGVGRYTFHTHDSFEGGFYGAGLGPHRAGGRRGEYRTVTGRRCGPEASTQTWRDEAHRHQCLLSHLGVPGAS
jgi:hypothetical protein